MTSSGGSKEPTTVYNDDSESSADLVARQQRAEHERRKKWGEVVNAQGGRDGSVHLQHDAKVEEGLVDMKPRNNEVKIG